MGDAIPIQHIPFCSPVTAKVHILTKPAGATGVLCSHEVHSHRTIIFFLCVVELSSRCLLKLHPGSQIVNVSLIILLNVIRIRKWNN